MQVRRLSRIAEVTPRRQLQEGGCIGAHSGEREEAGPTLDPAGTASSPERRREAGSAVPREVTEEGAEAPANLDRDSPVTRSRARGMFGAACDERRPAGVRVLPRFAPLGLPARGQERKRP